MARIKNTPQVIYLQVGVEKAPEFEEDIDFYELQEISWSTDKIHRNDLLYYHEDTVNELLDALKGVINFKELIEYSESTKGEYLGEKEAVKLTIREAEQAIKKAEGE